MNESQNNEQIDDDILECKADILRAKDVIPPFGKKRTFKPNPKARNLTSRAIEKLIPTVVQGSSEPPKTQPQHQDIPQFDLAEDIMAEHRKVSSQKRKRPGKEPESEKPKPIPQAHGYAVRQPEPVSRGHGQIIADIVARDIKKLCHSGNV